VPPVSPNSSRSSPTGKHASSSSSASQKYLHSTSKGSAQTSKNGTAAAALAAAAATASSEKGVEAMLSAAGGDTNELIALVLAHLNNRSVQSKGDAFGKIDWKT